MSIVVEWNGKGPALHEVLWQLNFPYVSCKSKIAFYLLYFICCTIHKKNYVMLLKIIVFKLSVSSKILLKNRNFKFNVLLYFWTCFQKKLYYNYFSSFILNPTVNENTFFSYWAQAKIWNIIGKFVSSNKENKFQEYELRSQILFHRLSLVSSLLLNRHYWPLSAVTLP